MFEPMIDPKSFLMDLFDVAVSAADPDKIIKQYLPERPKGRLVIRRREGFGSYGRVC